jgi:hypothetical protein
MGTVGSRYDWHLPTEPHVELCSFFVRLHRRYAGNLRAAVAITCIWQSFTGIVVLIYVKKRHFSTGFPLFFSTFFSPPLHRASSACIMMVLDAFPAAACAKSGHGSLPLHLSLQVRVALKCTQTFHNLTRTCHNLTRTFHNFTQTCHNFTRTCHNLTRTCHNLTRTCHNLTGTFHNFTHSTKQLQKRWLRCSGQILPLPAKRTPRGTFPWH